MPTADPTAAENFIIDGRRLQGQSEHLANFQIGYDNPDAGAKFRILVNYASDRIRRAENRTANIPAILEEVPMTVDLTYSRDFEIHGKAYEFSAKAQNIFGEDYKAFQEGADQTIIVDGYDRGTAFSVSIKRIF